MTPLFRTEVTEYQRRGTLGSVRSSRGPSTGVLVVFVLAVVTAIVSFLALVGWAPMTFARGQPSLLGRPGIEAQQPVAPRFSSARDTPPVVPAQTGRSPSGR